MRQKIADLLNTLYGFRNIIIWLILFVVSVFFRMKNYVDGGQWIDLTKNTFLGMVAVHTTEHLVSVVKEYVNVAKNTVDSSPIKTDPQDSNLVEGDENEPKTTGASNQTSSHS